MQNVLKQNVALRKSLLNYALEQTGHCVDGRKSGTFDFECDLSVSAEQVET